MLWQLYIVTLETSLCNRDVKQFSVMRWVGSLLGNLLVFYWTVQANIGVAS